MAKDTANTGAAGADDQQKTIIPKRRHKKSRLGCGNCKLRKVKCDESRPVCRACRIRREKCEYFSPAPSMDSSPEVTMISTSSSFLSPNTTDLTRVANEPGLCHPAVDGVDMKFLWFYTSVTYKSLSYNDDEQIGMNDMLQTVMVQHAFEAPFLMESILELASLHMQSLGQTSEPTRALEYRARSMKGYREAIEAARPNTFGALLGNSILRPILCTQFFRDPAFKDLYILDWIVLWKGIESIINITSVSSINNNGLRPLFAKRSPPPDLQVSDFALPKELLLMVSFIGDDEPDALERQTYQESLRVIGSLFEYLHNGMDSVMVLHIVTWVTLLPHRLLELAQCRRPRALVIIAYYAAFWKLPQDIWWLKGVGDRSIRDICHVLEPRWHKFLGIPLSALLTENNLALRRIFLGSGDE